MATLFKVGDTVLSNEIRESGKSDKIWLRKGEAITVLAIHDEVLICEQSNKNRFSINVKSVYYENSKK